MNGPFDMSIRPEDKVFAFREWRLFGGLYGQLLHGMCKFGRDSKRVILSASIAQAMLSVTTSEE